VFGHAVRRMLSGIFDSHQSCVAEAAVLLVTMALAISVAGVSILWEEMESMHPAACLKNLHLKSSVSPNVASLVQGWTVPNIIRRLPAAWIHPMFLTGMLILTHLVSHTTALITKRVPVVLVLTASAVLANQKVEERSGVVPQGFHPPFMTHAN